MQHWQTQGYRYYPLGLAMRQNFGCNVWKVSVDAGFSCPNSGGCIFCNTHSFAPAGRLQFSSVTEQLDEGIKRVRRHYKNKVEKFIAYFQPSTNTYAAPERLRQLYREALVHSEIAGLAIGTRPDALPEPVLDVLQEIARTHWLQLEIGLQSVHQKSLDFLHRGHTYKTFSDTMQRVKRRKLRTGIHLILGIPCENREDVLETAKETAKWKPDCIKLHNLYVVKDTKLAELYGEGNIILPTLEEYAGLVVDFLERQPPDTVIERISGEADSDYLIAPDWTAVKHAARNAVDREFRKRHTYQGVYYSD